MSRNFNTWDVFWTNQVQMIQCSRKVESGRGVAGANRSLVNTRSWQLECAKVLHESFLVSGITYGSKTMIWSENDRSSIRDVQMDNLIG